MEDERKTFYEDYLFFRKNCSNWKLFVKPKGKSTASKLSQKILRLMYFLPIGFIPALILDSFIFAFVIIASFFVTLLVTIFIDFLEIRKQLADNGLPLPPKYRFYKWTTDELENVRVRKVSEAYQKAPTQLLKERVSHAEYLIQRYSKTPDMRILKVFEFFGKQYMLVTVGVLLFIYKSGEDYMKSLGEFYKWFTVLLICCLAVGIFWNMVIVKHRIEKDILKVKSLEDYVSILKNVILLRTATNSHH